MELSMNEKASIQQYVDLVAQSLLELGVKDSREILEELTAHLIALVNDGESQRFEEILGSPSEYARELAEVSGISLAGKPPTRNPVASKSLLNKFRSLSLTQKLLAAILAYFLGQVVIMIETVLVLSMDMSPFFPGVKVAAFILLMCAGLMINWKVSGQRSLVFQCFDLIDDLWHLIQRDQISRIILQSVRALFLAWWWGWRGIYVLGIYRLIRISCESSYPSGAFFHLWDKYCWPANANLVIGIALSVALGITSQRLRSNIPARILFFGFNFLCVLIFFSNIYFLNR